MKGISSKLIHGDLQHEADVNRSLKTPIYETASFYFDTAEAVASAFTGKTDAYMYSRIANPTVSELERRLKTLAGAEHALCVSSGMAAIFNVLLTLCESGDNIIASPFLFSNTHVLFTKTLPALGIEVRFDTLDDPHKIADLIDERTRAVFLEIITNPLLKVYDIDKISSVTTEKNVLLIVDNSMLSPYVFQSAQHGVDIEVTSTTKFISGGATSVGGVVFTFPNQKWANVPKIQNEFRQFGDLAFFRKMSREIYRNVGACMSPHNAWLQLLGLESLTLRVDKICANALAVAQNLRETSNVQQVIYPLLPDHPNRALAQKYFGNHGGCLIGIELADAPTCYRFMNALKMIRRGTNFCDNKSIIIHPSSTMYADLTVEERHALGISEGYLRLAVGLEDVGDILDDVYQALV